MGGTYRLSTVTSLARWANSTRSSRSTGRSRGSSHTSLTTVSLKKYVTCEVSYRLKQKAGCFSDGLGVGVYLGARSSVATGGTIVTGRTLCKNSGQPASYDRDSQNLRSSSYLTTSLSRGT